MYVAKYLPLLHGLLIFSDDQQSKIGQVSAIDSDEHLPVTLRLWKPSIKAISLVTARFTQALNDDSLTRLRPEQILLNFKHKLGGISQSGQSTKSVEVTQEVQSLYTARHISEHHQHEHNGPFNEEQQ